jgi:hypothetical protein
VAHLQTLVPVNQVAVEAVPVMLRAAQELGQAAQPLNLVNRQRLTELHKVVLDTALLAVLVKIPQATAVAEVVQVVQELPIVQTL